MDDDPPRLRPPSGADTPESRLFPAPLAEEPQKREKIRKRIRLRNAVRIEHPRPIELFLQSVRQADRHRPCDADICGIANDSDALRENPVERPVRREIVDDYDRIGWAGLTLQPCERLLNKVGLIMGMDVGQNAHCLPLSDVEAPSEIYRCAWALDDRSNENAAGNRLLKSCGISACSITAAPLTGALRTPASRTLLSYA